MQRAELVHLRNRYVAAVLRATGGKHRVGGVEWTRDVISPVFLAGTEHCVRCVEKCVSAPGAVLDYGCGRGPVAVLLAHAGYRVTGIDAAAADYRSVSVDGHRVDDVDENARMRDALWALLTEQFGIEFRAFNGSLIPTPDTTFDAVVMHAVYEHIAPELLPSIIRDVNRVLRPGGHLFIFRTPRKNAYLEHLAPHLGLGAHLITYDEREVAAIVSSHGFDLLEQNITDFLPAFPGKLMALYTCFPTLFTALDRLALRTPLRRYAHHMSLVFRKR